LAGNAKIFQHREIVKQHVALERARKPVAGDGFRMPCRQLSVDQHLSAVRSKPARHEVEKRRLAGSVRPDHRVSLPKRHFHVQVRDALEPAERLAEISDFECVHCFASKRDLTAPTTPPRKKATTSMKKMPKNIMYSVVNMARPCLTRTNTAAP